MITTSCPGLHSGVRDASGHIEGKVERPVAHAPRSASLHHATQDAALPRIISR